MPHKHLCLNCNRVIAEGEFDCEIDRDPIYRVCKDCIEERPVESMQRANEYLVKAHCDNVSKAVRKG